jgi:zinc and cadmium transporter
MDIVFPLISVVVISFISLIGALTFVLFGLITARMMLALVALAVGALLGDTFLHLVPEIFEKPHYALESSLLIILGIIIFFILEHILHWHHNKHSKAEFESHAETKKSIKPVGRLILISDGVHNFIDGVIVGTGYMISVEIGIATTIAIILHEIPQELGDFGVLIHAGYTKTRALLYNALSGTPAILGVMLIYLLSSHVETVTMWALPIAAGSFIYIAIADLVPELHQKQKSAPLEFAMLALGIGIMYFLTILD